MSFFFLDDSDTFQKNRRNRAIHMFNSDLQQKFYQNLGRLFYAIAAADSVVRKEEIEVVKEIVKTQWLQRDDVVDDFGSDAAYQTEIIFDWMDANKPDPQAAFETFSEFYLLYAERFSEEIKKMILKAAREIAASFKGKNKSELVMLAKLQTLFKK